MGIPETIRTERRPAERWRSFALLFLILLAGCASSGGSSRGTVSGTAKLAADEQDERGRTRTRTDHRSAESTERIRTRTDHQSAENTEPRSSEPWHEDDEGTLLGNLIFSLIFGGDDEPDDHDIAPDTVPPVPLVYVGEVGGTRAPGPPSPDEDRDTGPAVPSVKSIAIRYERGRPAGDTVEHYGTVAIHYSAFVKPRARVFLGLFYGEGRPGPQETVTAGIDQIREIGVEAIIRGYLTPHRTLIGLYLQLGARAGGMSWDYQNPIIVPDGDGTSTVDSDMTYLIAPFIGAGCALLRVGPVQVGADVSWGIRFLGDNTLESFENDLFRDVGEWRTAVEASVFF